MTAPTFCMLCEVLHGRARRAVPPAPGVPALCIECRRSCERGDGAAEAARRPVSAPINPAYQQAAVQAALARAAVAPDRQDPAGCPIPAKADNICSS